MGPAELDDVLSEAASARCERGEVLFEQGWEADHFYLLLHGRLRITQVTAEGQQIIVRMVNPGDLFGIAKALQRLDYPGTATAAADSVVLRWPMDAWVGMLTVVVERPDYLSVNAVYLVPEARGTGLAERLFAAAIAWAWDRTDRVHLWVHEKNGRAEAFYQRFGFVRTGTTMKYPLNPSETEYEMVLLRDR